MQHEPTKAKRTVAHSHKTPFLGVTYGMFALCALVSLVQIFVYRSGNPLLHAITILGVLVMLIAAGPWFTSDIPVVNSLVIFPIASTLLGINTLSIVHAPWAMMACYIFVSLVGWGLVNSHVGWSESVDDDHVVIAVFAWFFALLAIVVFMGYSPPPMYYSPSIITLETSTKIEPLRLHEKTHGFLEHTIDHYLITDRPLPVGLRFGQSGEIYGTPTKRLDEPITVVVTFTYGRLTVPCGEVTFLPSVNEAADRRYHTLTQSGWAIYDGVMSLLEGIKQVSIPSAAILLYSLAALYQWFA